MKSLQVGGKEYYSDLQVMESNAGYYIGTEYYNPKEVHSIPLPGSRDTIYFSTREVAKNELVKLENGTSKLILRMSP